MVTDPVSSRRGGVMSHESYIMDQNEMMMCDVCVH